MSIPKYAPVLISSVVCFSVVWVSYQYVKSWLFNPLKQKKKDILKTIELTPEQKYKATEKTKFIEIYKNKDIYNDNIDQCFYQVVEYNKAIQPTNNDLEQKWKRRILFENTPRGNIIMYYDPFKRGFAYHTDQNISYSLLNTVVMKYVRMFRCLDFFIDEEEIPMGHVSPFMILDKETGSSKLDKKGDKIDTKSGPFLKSKRLVISNKNDKLISKEKIKNKIIYYGKLVNFDFLNKPIIANNANNANNEEKKETKSNLNYSDYKFWQSDKQVNALDIGIF